MTSVITLIISAMIAFVIGTVAEKVTPFTMPGGWAGVLLAGFIGAWVGPRLVGNWGPMVIGFSLVPALIGAFIVVIIVGIIAKIIDKLV
ncbi:GlsB/YeaQ/YmgE family stress response membrane protein [Calidifontibacillus oryziterrae]|uniref:GlsB/YeaQ/YmgE family stress response membrane protein n=1 Tax=Calidifontibacillus oryziterrae TaxID=1191699 RepID=UPI0002EBB361|nr:GlsB/YeaQ/YmgE family stress response membrane protein [Calidifontibacillus oryziterrae]